MTGDNKLTRNEVKRMVHAFLYQSDMKGVPIKYHADLARFRAIINHSIRERKAFSSDFYGELTDKLNNKEQDQCEL